MPHRPIVRGSQAGLLAGLLLLSPAARAQSYLLLDKVNQLFGSRMENLVLYQEALLPRGIRTREQYLRVGGQQYLLETAWATAEASADQSQRCRREDYELYRQGDQVVREAYARYQLTNLRPTAAGPLTSWGLYHRYSSRTILGGLDAGQVQLEGNLRPLDLLALRPDAFQSSQTLVVYDFRDGFLWDTLACYQLRPVSDDPAWAGQGYYLELRERHNPGNRRWHHNNVATTSWHIEPLERRITANKYQKPPLPNPDGSLPRLPRGMVSYPSRFTTWTRTYSTQTEFTEVHTGTGPPRGHARPGNTIIYYRRTFRQLSPTQFTDTYSYPDLDNKPAELTFTVVGTCRR